MKIAVLLTCHNRKEKTLECLNYLNNQNVKVLFDTFLVDDGCTDGTAEGVRETFPAVNIIQGDGNLFWNRGMRKAWETAVSSGYNYDGYLWLNDDTMLYDTALGSIEKFSEKYPNSIIVGSICSSEDKSKISYGGYIDGKRRIMPNEEGVLCTTFNGNCVFIPDEVCKKVGLLDNFYRHSYGDFDYGIKAQKKGFKAYVTPVIGVCDRNDPNVKWMSDKLSLTKRLKCLYSPTGHNPKEAFHFQKQTSLPNAIIAYIYLHLKTIFPRLFPTKNYNG